MKTEILRHLTTDVSQPKQGCADDRHHNVVVKAVADDATFEVFYRNKSTPYKAKQTSGVCRHLTDDELEAVNATCFKALSTKIAQVLSQDEDCVAIADIIAQYAVGFDKATCLIAAIKVLKSDNQDEMHYHLSNMLRTDDELDENVVLEYADDIIVDSHSKISNAFFVSFS